jgi:hypothetical protein
VSGVVQSRRAVNPLLRVADEGGPEAAGEVHLPLAQDHVLLRVPGAQRDLAWRFAYRPFHHLRGQADSGAVDLSAGVPAKDGQGVFVEEVDADFFQHPQRHRVDLLDLVLGQHPGRPPVEWPDPFRPLHLWNGLSAQARPAHTRAGFDAGGIRIRFFCI